jgi:hypothetical protein
LRVVTHERNRGYGGELISGFAAARKQWVFYTNGDGQFDPAELASLVRCASESVDVVQGYRLQRADGPLRSIVGRVYRRFCRALLRTADPRHRLRLPPHPPFNAGPGRTHPHDGCDLCRSRTEAPRRRCAFHGGRCARLPAGVREVGALPGRGHRLHPPRSGRTLGTARRPRERPHAGYVTVAGGAQVAALQLVQRVFVCVPSRSRSRSSSGVNLLGCVVRRKSVRTSTKRMGSSTWGKWPTPSMISSRLLGMASCAL